MSSPDASNGKAPDTHKHGVAQTDTDTIAAVATAAGAAGIGIVRLSGPMSADIARTLTQRGQLLPRRAHYQAFTDADGSTIDDGLVLYFPGPNSYTGEDTVELQGHGNPVILSMLLQRCCDLGARPARPGEFTERAFINGRIDLLQAEAVADLINADTTTAVQQAQRSLSGEFSRRVNELAQDITQLRVYVEATLDFPEEEIDFLCDGHVSGLLANIILNMESLLSQAKQGAVLHAGAQLVLAGEPNVGKSSLLNALTQQDTAIVTPLPGTTRDILKETIVINDVPVIILDTAGIRTSDDPVEQEGIRRAEQALANADLKIHLFDDAAGSVSLPPSDTDIGVYNKVDLSGRPPGCFTVEGCDCVAISAYTGAGLADLKQLILQKLGVSERHENGFSARNRHINALNEAHQKLLSCQANFSTTGAGELLATDLRTVHCELEGLTGSLSSEDLLGEIFSSFCIGK